MEIDEEKKIIKKYGIIEINGKRINDKVSNKKISCQNKCML